MLECCVQFSRKSSWGSQIHFLQIFLICLKYLWTAEHDIFLWQIYGFNLFQKIWKLTHSEEQEFSDMSVQIFKSQLTSLSLHCIHIHYTNVFEWQLYRMTFRIMLLFKVIILHSVKLWNVGWLILSEHPNKLLKYIAVSIYVNYNKLFNFWSTNILVKLLISLNLYQFHASSHAGHFSVIFNNYLRCFKGFFKITLKKEKKIFSIGHI